MMSCGKIKYWLAVALLIGARGWVPDRAGAAELGEVVASLSGWLEGGQLESGPLTGSWPGEEAYTGSLVAALVEGYELTCAESSREAAVAGGQFISQTASGNYYGDEAYALACLSRISGEERQDKWGQALDEFYVNVKERAQGSTLGYVSQFDQTELSRAVFYLAHHTVAAFYIDAEDKGIWRESLLTFLAMVDDESAGFPVSALGIATWALASTGPLDDALVDPNGVGSAYWGDKTLAELPQLLLEHQVTQGDLVGSFYWRFDHGDGHLGVAVAGYAEDLAFCTLGLVATAEVVDDPAIDVGIALARNVLLEGIADDGAVYEHFWYGGYGYMIYAAYTLRAVTELAVAADLNLCGGVDGADLATLAAHWRHEVDAACCSWGRADINRDGCVDGVDLQILGDSWLHE